MSSTLSTNQKISPFLWYNNNAEEAAQFYTSIFKNSRILSSSPMSVTFELEGLKIMGLNGGEMFKFTEAISLFVECEGQEEVDYYWDKLVDGGSEGQCGWLKDKYGLSWQIIPTTLGKLMSDPDKIKANNVMQAMLTMGKLDIQALQKAYDEE